MASIARAHYRRRLGHGNQSECRQRSRTGDWAVNANGLSAAVLASQDLDTASWGVEGIGEELGEFSIGFAVDRRRLDADLEPLAVKSRDMRFGGARLNR